MTTQARELPIVVEEELFPWQGDFMGIGDGGEVLPVPTFNFAKCGTKAGKTAGCALGLYIRFVNEPGSRLLWTAPVNKQLEPTWSRYFKPLLQGIPKSLLKVRDAYGMWQVELKPTGSLITLKSGDEPWNLRGDAYHGGVIDEAAHYQLESYYSVLTNLSENAAPLWAISTPAARPMKAGASWFDSGFTEGLRQTQAFKKGEIPEEDVTHKALRVPTWSNPKPEIQKWCRMIKKMAENGTLPGGMIHFNREYGAQDVEGDSAVFRHIYNLHKHDPEPPREGQAYVMGWDPAGSGRDQSVISVWNVEEKREVRLEIMLQVPIEQQYERLKHIWNSYFRPMGRVDATSFTGEVLMNELRKRELPFTPVRFNQYSKAQYVQMLSMAMEREEPTFIDHPIARAEMLAFGYEVLPSGTIRYGAPPGMRDDTVTARYLAWAELASGVIQVF